MDKVGVVGSGRWARVLITILDDILPPETKLEIFSDKGSKAITDWVALNHLENRIEGINKYANIKDSKLLALIVANSAKNHFMVAKLAIQNLIPVIIEKPLTDNYKKDIELINYPKDKKINLGLSHIFLFTEYLNNFRKLITSEKNISCINFLWEDKSNESRYGEIKSYDAGVPIYRDCLPHILSIIRYLVNLEFKLHEIVLEDDGSLMKIEMFSKSTKLNILMKRNAKLRKRIIQIKGNDSLQLDFTNEPGEIMAKSKVYNADIHWEDRSSPATIMLSSFLNSVFQEEMIDERLIPCPDILLLLDEVSLLYDDKRDIFLKDLCKFSDSNLNNIDYLLTEILLEKSIVEPKEVSLAIDKIKKICIHKGKSFEDLLNKDIESFVRIHT